MKIILLFLSLNLSIFAQENYLAVGTPPNPKVKITWDTYRNTSQIEKILNELAKAHPEWCQLSSLGKSSGNKDLWLLTITAPNKPHNTKPAFWIDGGIHANELQSVEVALYTAWFLLEMKDSNKLIKQLLQERTFYIMPIMSPDSRDAHMQKPNTTHSPRTGLIPIDDDLDGLVNEDDYDDLNGDGNISLMRLKDPFGQWLDDPERPGLLIRAPKGKNGTYTILGLEGFDNDNDGKIDEDGDGSYDPNRNWAWNWQPQQYQNGAHHYPFSIPEVNTVAQAIMKRRNIAGAQTYHNTGGMLLVGPGDSNDKYEPRDKEIYSELAKIGEKMLPGYKLQIVGEDLYPVFGGELDWFYKMRGVYCFNNELFTSYNFFHKPANHFMASNEEMHEFDKLLLFGQGVIPWQEVDHPKYGKVEVGGFTKNWLRQPPGFMLQEECHRNMAFTLFHANELPLVTIDSTTTKKLAPNLYEVTIALKNQKLCPTHSAQDLKYQINPPNFLTADGTGIKILTSLTSTNSLFSQPSQQEKNPAKVKIANINSNSYFFVKLIVEGNGKLHINFLSERAGNDHKVVDVE